MKDPLTVEETGWLSLMRFHALSPRIEIRKAIQIGRLRLSFLWKSKKNLMGRFGGGWNINFGFQFSSWRSGIVNLFICSLRWHWAKKDSGETK